MNKDQIIEAIKAMSVLELNELVAGAAGAAEGGAAEQTEFTVVLKEAGGEKIKVIKAVREITGLGLKEAKELVDGYKEAGYDGIVITNHFDKGIMHLWGETTEEHYQTYLRGYELAKEEGERVGDPRYGDPSGMRIGGLSGIRRDKGFYPGAYGHLWLQSAGII